MKLRNKKTGEVIDFDGSNSYNLFDCGDKILINNTVAEPVYSYSSLKELAENWEDVDSNNATNIPLIKDEKIRKAVRAWAEVQNVDKIIYLEGSNEDGYYFAFKYGKNNAFMTWGYGGFIGGLEHHKEYAIAELCGEEE